MAFPSSAVLWTYFIFIVCPLFVTAAHNGYSHNSHSSLHTRTDTANVTDFVNADRIVRQALAALAVENGARVKNPTFNKHEFRLGDQKSLVAPALQYDDANNTTLTRRQNSNSTTIVSSYSIPTELAQAARMLAEANPPQPQGNHSDVAASIRRKYSPTWNSTNIPAPLGSPDGLLGNWGSGAISSTVSITKRASSYWMADLPQRGGSPYASNGYKIWRNVREYGAKGDGVTDDTEAINRAIADGDRCGAGCPGSTTTPALIWFPGGTYLVSSPIIQFYNTQFLGDPHNIPTILGASSFVGLGIITSDVYTSDDTEWYLNTNNFFRSIKNFKIDIRATDPYAYICAIHWQVAQGTSLENIEFYMLYNSDLPENTQQGIYMENGSGGFMADLTFVGGNFGAYYGNQQFTTSHLIFVYCNTAVQVHWDWAWTMQDYIIETCANGLVIVGGAGAPKSDGQGVGSLVLVDSLISNTPNGIVTTLLTESSTSFLMQNVGFFGVGTAVLDNGQNKALLAGGDEVHVDSWGFGKVVNSTDGSNFASATTIPAMSRPEAMLGSAYDKMKPNLFTRRRPTYYDEPTSRIMDVKALGAKGDGMTDDTFALNSILEGAANTSSIVYIPFGIYIIKDTLRIPIGSRIIGQVWSQIMASGEKFEDELNPKVAVEVGKRGDRGIIEIQDILFTVRGPTAGAVVVEWNVQESSQGSVGLWDSHVRVGGATGTDLQLEQCPKLTGSVNPKCKAASMLMHLTAGSTAYLENVWLWTADHDNDKTGQDQIDVYVGRGMLIESSLAWLWGTAVEHCVLYQYQLSQATNILMGMIQTESPYFQPTPNAPQPFTVGTFPNDPTFNDCSASNSMACTTAWAVRIINTSSVYMLGAGLYSWFTSYSQDCLDTENCQEKGFEIRESHDIWIYNLCTKAIAQMISPQGSTPTYANDNVNGFLSSILAWLQGAEQVVGHGNFTGFQVLEQDDIDGLTDYVPESCKSALMARILCDDYMRRFGTLSYRGSLKNITLTDSVCDPGCGESLKSWFTSVDIACNNYNISNALPTMFGGRLWAAWNETCLVDPSGSGVYCNDKIDEFSVVSSIEEMPRDELCSDCFVARRLMMSKTPYSTYDEIWKADLEYIAKTCGISGNFDIPARIIDTSTGPDWCASNVTIRTERNTTCDDIALEHRVASAAVYMANSRVVVECNAIPAGIDICIPFECGDTYVLQPDDTCSSIEHDPGLNVTKGEVMKYNPWIDYACSNLQTGSATTYGSVLCLGPQGGAHTLLVPAFGDTTIPQPSNGYADSIVLSPENSTVAAGTTLRCGNWRVMEGGDTCMYMAFSGQTTIGLFMTVNPSLGIDIEACSDKLVIGLAYCRTPWVAWNATLGGNYTV